MAVSFFANLAVNLPNLADVLEGLFIPTIPSQAVLASIGLVGAVLMPHNLYLHSALVTESEIFKANPKNFTKPFFYFRLETALSLLITFIISAAVICTFAAYSTIFTNIKLGNAGDALATMLGFPAAKYIWGIGLLASGQASTMTGTLAGQYVMSGFIELRMSSFWRAMLTRGIAIIPSIFITFLDEKENFNGYLN